MKEWKRVWAVPVVVTVLLSMAVAASGASILNDGDLSQIRGGCTYHMADFICGVETAAGCGSCTIVNNDPPPGTHCDPSTAKTRQLVRDQAAPVGSYSTKQDATCGFVWDCEVMKNDQPGYPDYCAESVVPRSQNVPYEKAS